MKANILIWELLILPGNFYINLKLFKNKKVFKKEEEMSSREREQQMARC